MAAPWCASLLLAGFLAAPGPVPAAPPAASPAAAAPASIVPRLEGFYEIATADDADLRRVNAENAALRRLRIGDTVEYLTRRHGKPRSVEEKSKGTPGWHRIFRYDDFDVRVDAGGRDLAHPRDGQRRVDHEKRDPGPDAGFQRDAHAASVRLELSATAQARVRLAHQP